MSNSMAARQCLGFLRRVRTDVGAGTAYGGCTNTVRESALKVVANRKSEPASVSVSPGFN